VCDPSIYLPSLYVEASSFYLEIERLHFLIFVEKNTTKLFQQFKKLVVVHYRIVFFKGSLDFATIRRPGFADDGHAAPLNFSVSNPH